MRTRWPPLLIAGAAAIAAGAAWALPAARDQLLYNHSPSVPIGFYVRTRAPVARGAIVTVRALDVAPGAARARAFDGPRDRFLKRVAAQAGDRVCALEAGLVINNAPPLPRRSHTSTGEPLPAWSGCRVLGSGEFLLIGDTDDSFDGRYWGPVDQGAIEGVWRPLR